MPTVTLKHAKNNRGAEVSKEILLSVGQSARIKTNRPAETFW